MHEDDDWAWNNRNAWTVAIGLMFAPAVLIMGMVALILAGCAGCATDLPAHRSEAAPGPQWLNAGQLADICAVDGRACAAYLAATDDLFIVGAGHRPYCAPPKVALPALRAAFLDFIDAHPDARGYPASVIALSAWAKEWPCDRVGGAGPDPRPDVKSYRL